MEELLRLIRFYHQHYLGLMVPELALNAASSPFGEDKGDGGETGTEIPGRDMPALVDPSESPRGYHSLAWNPEDRLMDGTEPRVGESALGLSIDDFPTISATISTMSAVTTAMLATTIEYSSTSDGEEPNHLPSSSPSLSSASSLASDMYWDSPLEELYHTA
ncbi:hypothetical protein EV182_002415 [Spiromyces aspiralis]|uniref:Uncharacterized protein n=1 Tax=Spiromyces aspiralis TaxID=68401 RepID=A0ACC1HHM9_9FUNG|nr:hypothetical protein EV182_002415 [Spiromyces aspiralis]